MRRIIITGASGVLGSELIKQLKECNQYEIFGLTSSKELVKKKVSGVSYFDAENLSPNNTSEIFKSDSIVVHCAFSREEDGEELAKSLSFAKLIFTISSKSGCSVINISSRSIYGQKYQPPWTEDSTPVPDTLYAMAKYSSELLLESICSTNNCDFTSLRLAGLISPKLEKRLINRFIDQVLEGKDIVISGGEQQFAYLDVRDAAQGIIAITQIDPSKWNTIYNLGNIVSYNIMEIAESVVQVAKDIGFPNPQIDFSKAEITLFAEINSTQFFSDANWLPKYNLESIVRTLFTHKTT
ncbi:MAG: NAD(P)-dependent oxidoreductase [Bacteroidales bacterium]|nr:NAD(P)-dependent oxidoreductase [Bacteroidales bacterium]MDD3961928.1 NAD(P)-dependent oxidoreductase [Bacteroidales bacterium]MDY0286632.1 NAD(P)-dependent oxidoreductase [Bacteroidales bacterium]